MKVMPKKLVSILSMVLICILMVGCGKTFDASAYVQALLDNSYKNDSAKFVELELGTADEAAAIYDDGIEMEIASLLDGSDESLISDEILDSYRDTFRNLFAKAKYTVKDATKQDDGSFVVVVSYETLNVFTPAMEKYNDKVDEYTTRVSEESLETGVMPSDEDLYNELFAILDDCINAELTNATYSDPAEMDFRVELVDGVYQPNEDDILNLEMLLFDLYE